MRISGVCSSFFSSSLVFCSPSFCSSAVDEDAVSESAGAGGATWRARRRRRRTGDVEARASSTSERDWSVRRSCMRAIWRSSVSKLSRMVGPDDEDEEDDCCWRESREKVASVHDCIALLKDSFLKMMTIVSGGHVFNEIIERMEVIT